MTALLPTPAPETAPETAPSLAVRQLNHAWATRSVLEDIGFTLPAGRAIALVGPSGCGKTTLLHLCAGLLTVQEGQINNRFARSAMLFQQPHLLPWQTVLGNIALGLKARRTPKAARLAAARRMGHALGLDDIALAQFPGELSGGMQSRAALARALVLKPDLLLMDEPFAALDIGLKGQMHRLLLAEMARRQLAVLMITHDVMEAVTLADTVIVMAGQPGRMVWRLDLPLPPAQRGDAWIYRQTSLLLAQPAVRAAFNMPAALASPPSASSALPAAPADGCAPLASGSAIAAATPAASAHC